jgi:hypothetical protein
MPKFKVTFVSPVRVIDAPTEDAAISGFYNYLDSWNLCDPVIGVEASNESPDLTVDEDGDPVEEE